MNQFEVPDHASDRLLCVASRKSALTEVTNDLFNYVSSGETAGVKFINDRLLSGKLKFHVGFLQSARATLEVTSCYSRR